MCVIVCIHRLIDENHISNKCCWHHLQTSVTGNISQCAACCHFYAPRWEQKGAVNSWKRSAYQSQYHSRLFCSSYILNVIFLWCLLRVLFGNINYLASVLSNIFLNCILGEFAILLAVKSLDIFCCNSCCGNSSPILSADCKCCCCYYCCLHFKVLVI